jgi:hypothetical protein
MFQSEITDFETDLIDVMTNEECSMAEALAVMFQVYEVDTKSVIAIVVVGN